MHVGCACLSLVRSGADRALKQWSTIELPKYASHFWLGTHINREIEPCAIDEGKAAHGPTLAAGHSRVPLHSASLPHLLTHSLTRSLCLSHTSEELMMLTIIVKINSIRGYRRLKKLPVMTCWISESKTEVKTESERGFCSLVRHRLCVCVCMCVLCLVVGLGHVRRLQTMATLVPLPLPLLLPQAQACPFVRLND